MCGLVAVFEPGAVVKSESLRRAVDALKHRGPDGQRVWLSEDATVGMGHARLAIIGLADGPQPVCNETGTIQAVVNGEFYDFERVRNELKQKGHAFSSGTDSEILVHLYEEYGTDCLTSLRGEFAFVLWDSTRRLMFAGRDRFGIKPLVYARTPSGGWAFASEAKALFELGVSAGWDYESFFHAAGLQYVLPDRTLFEGIMQIKPGHFLVAQDGSSSTHCYWDLDFDVEDELQSSVSEEHCVRSFSDKLHESVRLRLRADFPVCAHLSGGLDSASIVGIAARLSSQPLHCFTVTFEEEQYDELPVAQRMAAHVGANFHPVAVSQSDILEHLAEAVAFSEGLAVNGHLTAKYLLHREISRAGFRVTLSGEGSDEILAGYAHLRQDLFSADGRADLTSGVARTNSASTGIMLKQGQSLPLTAVERALSFVPAYLEAKGTLGYKINEVLSRSFSSQFQHRDCYAELINAFNVEGQLLGRSRVHQSTYMWSKTALANYILKTLGDGTEMANAVEGRVPFLDHELFEEARRMPMSMKINGTREKYVLREAVRGIVTDEIYNREKHPFVAPPLSRFFDKQGLSRLHDELSSSSFAAVPFFDQAKILSLLERLPSLPDEARAAYDPVFMTALSAKALQSRFKL